VELVLERGQPVEIVLDRGLCLTATVAAVGAAHLDLAPVDVALALPAPARWCPATVAGCTPLGTVRHQGILTAAGERTVRLTPVGEPLRVQRRAYVRVPAELAAAVIAADHRVVARTLDVSIGGMLLAAADPLAPGDRVRFALDLGTITVSGDGQVVRGSDEGARAVRFAELQGRVERAVARYVARRQRELIRSTAR
jgi:hypothetical protein